MEFYFRRSYRGTTKCVIFDWAGTTIDFGSCAPAAAFIEGYRRKGVDITVAQARAPMGLGKWEHILEIGRMDSVAARWEEVHGQPLTTADVDDMYDAFVPVLLEVLPDYTTLIPGTVVAMEQLRQLGCKLAGTTGYFEEAMNVCVAAAAEQGYTPDSTICATQVSAGRPAPWMIYTSMNRLEVYPREAVVKVGDTKPDIDAGLNAGVWTVGVAMSGNQVGLSVDELDALDVVEKQARIATAKETLLAAGAHFVVESVADVPAVVAQINDRLQQGEQP